MKSTNLLATVIVGVALLGGTMQGTAQIQFSVDPNQPWYGYVNVFSKADNSYQFGFVEGNLTTMAANFAAGPSTPLTLSPNSRIYDQEINNPVWVDQGTFEPLLYIEANTYQESIDESQIGKSVTFSYDVIADTLPAGYSAVGFIKVLDAFGSWATTQITTAPLVAGQANTLFIPEVFDTGAGTASVQAGFWLVGDILSAGDPNTLTGVQIMEFVPEPTTFALAGLGAAALLIIRRRN